MSPPNAGREAAPSAWRRVWAVGLLGLLVATLITGARVGLPTEVDPTAPFLVGAEWDLAEALAARGIPVTSTTNIGYDGQWFLGLASDPLLHSGVAETFDRPQYRAMRPLFPVAGWLLAAGQPSLIPYGLLLAGILAVGLGCAATARIATGHGRSRWWGVLFAAIPGAVVGLQYGTAEPMGLALAALGLALLLDRRAGSVGRAGWAGVAFAGAALTKETYLAFAGMAAVFLAVQAGFRGWAWLRQAALVAGPGAAALVIWWVYVSAVVPTSGRTPNHLLDPPLLGWWRVFELTVRSGYPDYPWLGPLLLAGSLVLLVVALLTAVRLRYSPLAYQVFLWSPFALSLVHIMLERFLSAQRVLAPAVLAAVLLLVSVVPERNRQRDRRPGTGRIDPAAPPAARAAAPAANPAAGPD